MPHGSPLRERDGPLSRRTATLRRASRGLQRADGVRVCAHANTPPCALSREVAQHARLRRLRAAPRWFESAHARWKPTARARRPFLLVHGHAPTCQSQPSTSSRRSRVRTGERTAALSLSGGGAARAPVCSRCQQLLPVPASNTGTMDSDLTVPFCIRRNRGFGPHGSSGKAREPRSKSGSGFDFSCTCWYWYAGRTESHRSTPPRRRVALLCCLQVTLETTPCLLALVGSPTLAARLALAVRVQSKPSRFIIIFNHQG